MRCSVPAAALCFLIAAASPALAAKCIRADGATLRDMQWTHAAHPLVGRVFKGDRPIVIGAGTCTRSPLQQLIVEVWDTIRSGGIALLGELHDNPEHHAVRGDILWPRVEQLVSTQRMHPAAVFEHIRISQQPQLDSFYAHVAKNGRLWDAHDLLRELHWKDSGWPSAVTFYPLFDAALGANLPITPGNAVRKRMRDVVRGAPDPTDLEAARLKLAKAMPEPLVDALKSELRGSHCGALPESALGPMSLAQRYTDALLAETLVEAARKHGGAFLLAGNGHVRSDRGVPWYVRQLAPERKIIAVMLLEVEDGTGDAAAYLPEAMDGTVATDFVVFTPRHRRPDPCEQMRRNIR